MKQSFVFMISIDIFFIVKCYPNFPLQLLASFIISVCPSVHRFWWNFKSNLCKGEWTKVTYNNSKNMKLLLETFHYNYDISKSFVLQHFVHFKLPYQFFSKEFESWPGGKNCYTIFFHFFVQIHFFHEAQNPMSLKLIQYQVP